MGGCCCCSSKGAEINARPAYYYRPRAPEESLPLSSRHGATFALSTRLLVDTNLDTSIPDTYRPPPTPMPYDVALGHPQTPPGVQEISCNDNDVGVQGTNNDSIQETDGGFAQEVSAKCEDIKESNNKLQGDVDVDVELGSAKDSEFDLTNSVERVVSAADEEDVCPTCLEEYDPENPKIMTKCEHHFHLSCILEWLERSDTCPVCDQEMIISLPYPID